MFEITEQYGFVATHELYGLTASHPCSGVHLHRWTVELLLALSKLLPTDGPSEQAMLEPFRQFVASQLDNKHLNDVVTGPATPARLAIHLATWCEDTLAKPIAKSLAAVTVWADGGARARYIFPRVMPGTGR